MSEQAFEKVSDEKCEEAKKWIERCGSVICCRKTLGTLEEANASLLDYAKRCGKLKEKTITG